MIVATTVARGRDERQLGLSRFGVCRPPHPEQHRSSAWHSPQIDADRLDQALERVDDDLRVLVAHDHVALALVAVLR